MTKAQIESRVEGWNWNMNIFEIYDELRDGHTGEQQEQLLTFAYNYFNNDVMKKVNVNASNGFHEYVVINKEFNYFIDTKTGEIVRIP